ncbi:KRR1 small subunit processome component homolog [Molossus molossus]|uniref:KRR1 small subunit processome component-like protein n=1 Tax=Molossus molossus TaxID=27622 RepID=A0A7J8FZV6_MOLMO|nr:KRR1 small subunit processome component homolog [Molossus molossus]KAF6452682.1 KRR1 small subunit processome component-like protein [Molossus molossus]
MAPSEVDGPASGAGRNEFRNQKSKPRTEMNQNSSLYLMVGRDQLFPKRTIPEDCWRRAVLQLCSQNREAYLKCWPLVQKAMNDHHVYATLDLIKAGMTA